MTSKELQNINLNTALGVRKIAEHFKVKWYMADEKNKVFTLKRPGVLNFFQNICIYKLKNFLDKEISKTENWSINYVD